MGTQAHVHTKRHSGGFLNQDNLFFYLSICSYTQLCMSKIHSLYNQVYENVPLLIQRHSGARFFEK